MVSIYFFLYICVYLSTDWMNSDDRTRHDVTGMMLGKRIIPKWLYDNSYVKVLALV